MTSFKVRQLQGKVHYYIALCICENMKSIFLYMAFECWLLMNIHCCITTNFRHLVHLSPNNKWHFQSWVCKFWNCKSLVWHSEILTLKRHSMSCLLNIMQANSHFTKKWFAFEGSHLRFWNKCQLLCLWSLHYLLEHHNFFRASFEFQVQVILICGAYF